MFLFALCLSQVNRKSETFSRLFESEGRLSNRINDVFAVASMFYCLLDDFNAARPCAGKSGIFYSFRFRFLRQFPVSGKCFKAFSLDGTVPITQLNKQWKKGFKVSLIVACYSKVRVQWFMVERKRSFEVSTALLQT